MKRILSFTGRQVLEVVYFLSRAFVEWYFRYYDLPFKHEIECYLDDPRNDIGYLDT